MCWSKHHESKWQNSSRISVKIKASFKRGFSSLHVYKYEQPLPVSASQNYTKLIKSHLKQEISSTSHKSYRKSTNLPQGRKACFSDAILNFNRSKKPTVGVESIFFSLRFPKRPLQSIRIDESSID